MNVYLQRTDNGHYFRRIGEWVRDCREACEFASSLSALECARVNNLKGVQIILKFEAVEYDVSLPIREALLTKARADTEFSNAH